MDHTAARLDMLAQERHAGGGAPAEAGPAVAAGPRHHEDRRGARTCSFRSAKRRRCAAPRWQSGRARSWRSWGRADRASPRLLHCLAGILVPDQGEVWFGGQQLDTLRESGAARCAGTGSGSCSSSASSVPELTAEENVALPLLLCGSRRGPAMAGGQEVVSAALGLDGLGQRQVRGAVRRAGAARRAGPGHGRRAGGAVRRRADRLPGLGVRGTGDGACSPRSAREQGSTVILVTHDARVAAYADREVIVRDGTVGTLTGAQP